MGGSALDYGLNTQNILCKLVSFRSAGMEILLNLSPASSFPLFSVFKLGIAKLSSCSFIFTNRHECGTNLARKQISGVLKMSSYFFKTDFCNIAM